MPYPSLVVYSTEAEYRLHFERVYCQGPVFTFDGIPIRFQKRQFFHAFFESVRAKDDTFSRKRAERIDWIKVALQDPHSDRYVGWDSRRRRYDSSRRVAVVMGNYVVVVAFNRTKSSGRFITAFLADSGRTIRMIRRGPRWT